MGEAYFKYGRLVKAQDALFQENACDVNFFVAQDLEDKKEDGGSESSWPGQNVGGTNGVIRPINGLLFSVQFLVIMGILGFL